MRRVALRCACGRAGLSRLGVVCTLHGLGSVAQTGKRTRLLIEVVRVRVPPDLLVRPHVGAVARRCSRRCLCTSCGGACPNRARPMAGHWSLKPATQVRPLCPVPTALEPPLSENLAPLFFAARPRSLMRGRTSLEHSSEAEWSGTRLLTGLLAGSIPAAGALARSEMPYKQRKCWFDSNSSCEKLDSPTAGRPALNRKTTASPLGRKLSWAPRSASAVGPRTRAPGAHLPMFLDGRAPASYAA